MYALPCSCGHTLAVSPGQAGDRLTCPECQQQVSIPLLRDLRQLPQVDQGDTGDAARDRSSGSFAIRLLFGLAGFVALAATGLATFALISAMAVEIESDTEQHVEHDRAVMMRSNPADLVERWSQMASTPLTERRPFLYQQDAFKKARWQRLMVTGYSVAGVAVLIAVGLGVYDRRKSPPSGR